MTNNVPRSGKQGFLSLFLVLSVAICLIGAGAYFALADNLRQREERQLEAIAHLKAEQLELWLGERLSDALAQAVRPSIVGRLSRTHRPEAENDAKRSHRALKSVQEAYGYISLELFDAQGRRVDRVGLEFDSSPLRHAEWSKRLLASTEPQLVDFYATGNPAYPIGLAVAATIRELDQEGSPALGYVLLHIDPSQQLYPSIQSWPVPSQTAEALLVRRDGDDALFLNELRHKKLPPLSLRTPLTRTDAPAVQAVLKGHTVLEGNDYRDVRVFSVTEPIRNTPWFIVVKEDRSEVLDGLRIPTLLTISFVLLAVGMTGSLLLLRYRRQQLDQARALSLQERLFHDVLDHSADAVVIVKPGGELTYANAKMIALAGCSGETVLAMNFCDLFPASAASEVSSLLVDIVRHRVLQRELFISFNASNPSAGQKILPVDTYGAYLPDGSLYFSFHDISERVRLESELKAREERFRDFSESSADWFWETDTEHRFTYLSANVMQALGGRSGQELIGRSRMEVAAEDSLYLYQIWEEHAQNLAQRIPFRNFEYSIIDGAGRKAWLSVSGLPFYDAAGAFAGYRGIGQVVTPALKPKKNW